MDIDKDQIQKIIDQMEASEAPFYEACQMLKELINPKWEPKAGEFILDSCGNVVRAIKEVNEKYAKKGASFVSVKLAETARDMNKRNQWILQAKIEKGFGGGCWGITYEDHTWRRYENSGIDNPELTFETKEQAEEVIRMCRLNES